MSSSWVKNVSDNGAVSNSIYHGLSVIVLTIQEHTCQLLTEPGFVTGGEETNTWFAQNGNGVTIDEPLCLVP